MRRIPAVPALVALSVILASCGQQDMQQTDNQALIIDGSVPAEVQAEMRAWYAALPRDMIAGVKNPQLMYTAKNGEVYSSKAGVKIRQGRIVKDLQGLSVRFNDGSQGPAYPVNDFKPSNLNTQEKNYTTCNSTDGPYYRSYSSSGYGAIYTAFTPYAPNFPAPIGSRSWAAYNYLGGQASNGASEVDAGLVYYDSKLRVFTRANGVYKEWGVSYLGLGYSHPTQLYVTGSGQLAMSVATPNGGTILANISAYGWNTAGTDQYLKRMATVANGDLAGYYNSSYRYNVQFTSVLGNSQLGTFSGNTYSYSYWSGSRVFSSACNWPSTSTVYTANAPTANSVSVYIDMTK